MGIKSKLKKTDDSYNVRLIILWEALRRNDQYKDDFERFKNNQLTQDAFVKKWVIPPCDPNLSFFQLVQKYHFHSRFHQGFKWHPWPIEFYLDPRLREIGPPAGYINLPSLDNPTRMEIELNLNYTKEEILSHVGRLLDRFHARSRQRGTNFPIWERRFAVWDLRNDNQELTYAKIAKQIGSTPDLCRKDFALAFEKIYRRKYNPVIFREELKKKGISLDEVGGPCSKCRNRECIRTRDLCPPALKYVNQDYVGLKESFVKDFDKVMNAHQFSEWITDEDE